MNNKNVILIVVDAVRSYKSGRDERDRLDVYNNLTKKNFISFDKLVVSAPSSVMSAVTMLTGLPSFMLAQNYNDFQWEPDLYDIVPNILAANGYDLYGMFFAKELRDKLKGVFPPMQKEFLVSGTNLRQKKWSNKELFGILRNHFEKSITSSDNPFFLMAWFNSRFDWGTSDIISELIEYIQDKGYLEESLVIVTADHGYPDQRRGLTSDGVDLKKSGIAHDLIVTDDNICVPLAVHFPSNYQGIGKLSSVCSEGRLPIVISQECLAPTILDVLDMNFNDMPIKPERDGFVSEVLKKNRIPIRSDARFIFQPNRIISIRSEHYKYVIDREKSEEYYYDLIKDPLEDNPIFNLSTRTGELKKIYNKTEKKALAIWFTKIENKLKPYDLSVMLSPNQEYNVFFLGTTVFIAPFLQHLQRHKNRINLYVINRAVEELLMNSIDTSDIRIELIERCHIGKAIVVLEDSLSRSLTERLKLINAQKITIIDALLNVSNSKRTLLYRTRVNYMLGPINRMFLRKDLYRESPLLFFSDIMYLVTRSYALAKGKALVMIRGSK